ncbi:hypothetical protein ED733_008244 [Metarhizium rileyi]|uniref:Nuclear pore assembly and biogenesis protein, APQ12 n=1 Tax=Metarhizium rileyi (strain RCEF 4871) TaxID=1649241 RepID=A0A5C6GIH7_METRR|nr:hypothetical protein ED733_008244 [Metarhizium rileyi]
MEASLTWRLLTELLPPDLALSVRTHLLNPGAPFQVYKHAALAQVQTWLASLAPVAQPVVDKALALAVENQGVTGIVALLCLLTAVVVVMNWVRRLILWWTRLVMRVVFWSVVVVVLAWVLRRGVAESVMDAVVFGGKVVGYLSVLKDFWWQEYERYEAREGTSRHGGAGRASGRR